MIVTTAHQRLFIFSPLEELVPSLLQSFSRAQAFRVLAILLVLPHLLYRGHEVLPPHDGSVAVVLFLRDLEDPNPRGQPPHLRHNWISQERREVGAEKTWRVIFPEALGGSMSRRTWL